MAGGGPTWQDQTRADIQGAIDAAEMQIERALIEVYQLLSNVAKRAMQAENPGAPDTAKSLLDILTDDKTTIRGKYTGTKNLLQQDRNLDATDYLVNRDPALNTALETLRQYNDKLEPRAIERALLTATPRSHLTPFVTKP